MELEFTDSFKRITEKDIAALEQSLQLKLPADYIAFLLEHNGGRPTPGCFDTPMEGFAWVRIMYFFGIGGKRAKYYDIEKAHNTLSDRFPAGSIAIACDEGGNHILLDTNTGEVSFFFHETEEQEVVADTFQEFIDGLYEPPEEEESEFDRALEAEDLDYFKRRIAEEGLENILDAWDRPATIPAALWGKLQVVQLFVEQGAPLKAMLVAATGNDHIDIVRYLLSKGADVNERDEEVNNQSALLKAARGGNLSIVKLLIDAGADIRAVDSYDQTIVDMARMSGDRELIKFVKTLKIK